MSGPLDGIKVLDISGGAAGPIAASLLAELGADVIKVEAPWGDFVRNRAPYKNGVDLMVTGFSRSKRSLVLDLTTDRDRALMMQLVEWADIFLENFKGGTVERMGLGYETLREINPRIIYASSGSYGSRGPLRSKSTMGNTSVMFSGWGSISGPPGGRGETPRNGGIAADPVSPTFFTTDILLALYHRERTGVGQKVDTAQILTSVAFLQTRAQQFFATGEQPALRGSASDFLVPSEAFATADDFLAVEAPTDGTWRRLCGALGVPELAADARFASNAARVEHRDELVPQLAAIFKSRPLEHWLSALREAEVPCARVSATFDDLYADPQVRANRLVFEMDHPVAGPLKTSAVPWEFSRTPAEVKSLGPMLGEHSAEIRAEFGFQPEDERELAAARAARLVGR